MKNKKYKVGDYVSVDISNYVADVLSDIERTEQEQEEVRTSETNKTKKRWKNTLTLIF